MPVYTTTIKLLSATQNDYDRLFEELKKNSFKVSYETSNEPLTTSGGAVTLSTKQPTMMEVSYFISEAASKIGRKFSFTVRKEKMPF